MQTLKRSVHNWILSDKYKPVPFNSQLVLYKHDSQQQPRQQKGQATSSGQTVQIKEKAKKHVLERKVSVTEIVLFTGIAWGKYFLSRNGDLQQHSCPWSALTFETAAFGSPVPSAARVTGSGRTLFACESAWPNWFCAALFSLRSSASSAPVQIWDHFFNLIAIFKIRPREWEPHSVTRFAEPSLHLSLSIRIWDCLEGNFQTMCRLGSSFNLSLGINQFSGSNTSYQFQVLWDRSYDHVYQLQIFAVLSKSPDNSDSKWNFPPHWTKSR